MALMPRAGTEFAESYLKHVFSFLGITDLTFVRAEGLNVSPESREQSLQGARASIQGLSPAVAAALAACRAGHQQFVPIRIGQDAVMFQCHQTEHRRESGGADENRRDLFPGGSRAGKGLRRDAACRFRGTGEPRE